jgi:hypothetical protein
LSSFPVAQGKVISQTETKGEQFPASRSRPENRTPTEIDQ